MFTDLHSQGALIIFVYVTCPDIFTPSYTSMEVGVVLARQRMKTLKYQTISIIHFFMSIEQRYQGSFGQKLPPFFLDLGRSIVEEIGEAKTHLHLLQRISAVIRGNEICVGTCNVTISCSC